MREITEKIAKAVAASGLVPFVEYGFATEALQTDYDVVCEMNEQACKYNAALSDTDWIVGHDGSGNDYVVSTDPSDPSVRIWDHEVGKFSAEFETLDEFIAHALEIELENQKDTEQSGGEVRG